MFLQLAHTRLDVYKFSSQVTLECYQITKRFPSEEKFGLVQQIRRASISVHLNLAEGCSRKSAVERRRFYEISRGSLIELDAAIGIACQLGYVTLDELKPLGETIVKTFKILSGMIR